MVSSVSNGDKVRYRSFSGDVYDAVVVSGLGKIENIGGGCLRFWLYTTQAPIEGGAPAERVVVAKVIAPMSAVPDAVLQMMAAIGERAGKALELVATRPH